MRNRKKANGITVNAIAGISAAWFGLTYLLSAAEPYNSALSKINQIKGRDKKSLLLRERLAEEAMQKPAELVKMLAYASTLTNFIATASLLDTVNADLNMYAGIAMLTSFLPLIFKNKYQENYEKHLEYKKKIYAPLKSAAFRYDPLSGSLTPVTQLTWTF